MDLSHLLIGRSDSGNPGGDFNTEAAPLTLKFYFLGKLFKLYHL